MEENATSNLKPKEYKYVSNLLTDDRQPRKPAVRCFEVSTLCARIIFYWTKPELTNQGNIINIVENAPFVCVCELP